MKFRYIFAGETIWAWKPKNEALIERLSRFGIEKIAEMGVSWRRKRTGEPLERGARAGA